MSDGREAHECDQPQCFSTMCVLLLSAFNLTSPWTWCANLIPPSLSLSFCLSVSALPGLLATEEQMESVLWPRYVHLKPSLWNWWRAFDMIGFVKKTVQGQEGTRRTHWLGADVIVWVETGLGFILYVLKEEMGAGSDPVVRTVS